MRAVAAAEATLEQGIAFRMALGQSGLYRYFTVNLFSGLENNPFLADKRITDIDFRILPAYMAEGSYTIPAGYVFEEVPANLLLQLPDSSIRFSRTTTAAGNLLNISIRLEFSKERYSAGEYPAIQQLYKKCLPGWPNRSLSGSSNRLYSKKPAAIIKRPPVHINLNHYAGHNVFVWHLVEGQPEATHAAFEL